MTASALSLELRAFLPNIVASEILAAKAGIKVARTGLKPSNAARLTRLGRNAGFHVIVGEHECFPRRDRGKGGWCNGSKEGAVRGRGYLNVYVAQTPLLASRAREAESQNDDTAFADFLGTPLCCRRFYDAVKEQAALEQNDFFPFCAPQSLHDPVSAFLNLGAQYFDAALVSHFPCSMNCQKSIRLARERANLLLAHDREWLVQTINLLNHATLYTEYLGVYLLGKPRNEENRRVRFDKRSVRGTSQSRVFRALAIASSAELSRAGQLEIRSEKQSLSLRPRNARLFAPLPASIDDL